MIIELAFLVENKEEGDLLLKFVKEYPNIFLVADNIEENKNNLKHSLT